MSHIRATENRPLSSNAAGWLPQPPVDPLFELAAWEAQAILNLPLGHARLTLLAAAASVFQGHHVVQRPDSRMTPLALTVALQGAPGPATMFYDFLLHKTRRVMTEQMAQHSARLTTCADEWTRWQQEYEHLLCRDDYRGIAVLMECQPDTPRLFQTHYEQMPWKEIYLGLQRNVPCAAWLVPEHPGRLMLETLLDDTGFAALANGDIPACLTTLMLCDREQRRRHKQPEGKWQANRPGVPHVLYAETLERYVTEDAPNGSAHMSATEAIEARLATRHRRNLPLIHAPGMMKTPLSFSVAAQAYWQTRLRVEATGRDHQPLAAQVDGIITPLGDTLARVAALLHLVEDEQGDSISVETLQRACMICCPWLVSHGLASADTTASPGETAPRSAENPSSHQAYRRALPARRPLTKARQPSSKDTARAE